jgi:hypothetical protein
VYYSREIKANNLLLELLNLNLIQEDQICGTLRLGGREEDCVEGWMREWKTITTLKFQVRQKEVNGS